MSSCDDSQNVGDIRDNTVKIVDEEKQLYGTGFFIDVNKIKYCITCHHCIYQLDQIYIQKNQSVYKAQWIEEYSNMELDLAVLQVENCPIQHLKHYPVTLPEIPVYLWGYPLDDIHNFPEGKSVEGGQLSKASTPFVWDEPGSERGSNKWNKKPTVRVQVFQIEEKFKVGFSGGPVCYEPTYQVIGVFTAKDDDYGYVIPIQTLLEGFGTHPFPNKDLAFFIKKGNEFADKRAFEQAIKQYDQVIDDKNYLKALSNKGLMLNKMGKFEEAIVWLDRALALQPDDPDSLNNRGWASYGLREFDDAFGYYEKALIHDPSFFQALNNKGNTYLSLNKYQDALQNFDKALKINPNYKSAWSNKGNAFFGMKNYEKALECYNKALEIDPKFADAWSNKGNVLNYQGKYDDGLECSKKATEIHEKHYVAWNNSGESLEGMKNYEKALECYNKALEIRPDYITAMNNKATVLVKLNKVNEAIDCYDNILEIDPNYVRAMIRRELIAKFSTSKNFIPAHYMTQV